MGLTYTLKPDFIDRMIEIGSYHFFLAFGQLNMAAAEAEIGENIGISKKAVQHAEDALWHTKKALEIYGDLVSSIEGLPVSDDVKRILSTFDFDKFKDKITKDDTIKVLPEQWEEFVGTARRIEPVTVIKQFVEKVARIQGEIETAIKSLSSRSSRNMNTLPLHASFSRFIDALAFGQYIAEFNRTSREMFAKK